MSAVDLSPEELAILESCLPDGAPPREIKSAKQLHRKLEALGLMNRRVGPMPNGRGTADFWSTNENGAWALRVGKHGGRS